MKYVRMKSGEIDIMEDGASIPADAETIFSTEPAVYQGTWETEKLHTQRADVVQSDEGKTEVVEGGLAKTEAEKKLEGHMRGREKADRPYWTEPHKAHPKDKVCLNCGKVMKEVRPNRKFCSENCRKRYSEKVKRAEKRAVRDFKPHVGKEGQIYYMVDGKISFVPAIWCDTEKRAVKYVKERYEGKVQEIVLEQIKEVMGK